jgi:hypothetical protein
LASLTRFSWREAFCEAVSFGRAEQTFLMGLVGAMRVQQEGLVKTSTKKKKKKKA